MGSPEMRSGGDKIGSPEVAEVVRGGVWAGVTSGIGALSANRRFGADGKGPEVRAERSCYMGTSWL
jgi:hypothetical protein